jgi:hypothetical protein
MNRVVAGAIMLLASCSMLSAQLAGTWTLYPPQATVNTANIEQPINADGTSIWSANKGVVPVQFDLATSPGPVVFSSIGTTYSYLSFAPTSSLIFSDITTLSAVYTFASGNCHGGALRWSVTVQTGTGAKSIFIYYGGYPNFTDCTTAGPFTNQSGLNMINQSDLRYDTSQLGGTFYDTYAHAVSLAGASPVVAATLVLDAGWGGDQVITPLQNVTVNDNTFVPLSGGSTSTCNLPPANIQVSRLVGTPSGVIDEVTAIQPNDTGTAFRIIDCKYMYNLAAKSLGVGRYQVQVIINGNPAAGPGGVFTLK